MKHIRKFTESFDSMTTKEETENILSIKVKCTNTENINPNKLPDLDWIDSEFWIRECLEKLLTQDTIEVGDILCIGTSIYNKSIVKIQSITPLIFDMNKEYFLKVRAKFNNNMITVFKNPDIEFTFDNKYNFLKLFSEMYPELYRKLNNRYNSIEYGGNMVDFNGEWVIYSEWDSDDESGTVRKLCRIEDLIN